MASVNTWERIERQKLRGRERRTRHNRPGDRPHPSRPVGTDMLPQIKHIVVLMMENHRPSATSLTCCLLLDRGRASSASTRIRPVRRI